MKVFSLQMLKKKKKKTCVLCMGGYCINHCYHLPDGEEADITVL